MIKQLRKLKGRNRILDKILEEGFRNYKKFYLRSFHSGKKIHTTSSGFKMKLDITESTPMLGRKLGTYEEAVSDFLKENLGRGDVYIDVGANKGYHALMASRKISPEGKVFAFEPNPDNIDDLNENIDLNDSENIQVVTKALSDEKGTVDFYLGDMSGTGSIKQQEKQPDITVETITFDAFLDSHKINESDIQALKIDVEGAEIQVLEGMKTFLKDNEVKIALELHKSEVKENKFLSKVKELNLEVKGTKDNFYFLES